MTLARKSVGKWRYLDKVLIRVTAILPDSRQNNL